MLAASLAPGFMDAVMVASLKCMYALRPLPPSARTATVPL